ncbi:MAG: ferrous iron transporter B, partial [Desulfobacteraceae bacterium]|nr:ferrous iron transporter B [Desulfobacteraceae bacterium]
MKILLMGNPNVGKSVVFNRLTGANVIVSNYAGTTVEFTKGSMKLGAERAELIDVPGTYTLEPTCKAEEIAVEMLNEHADGEVVINVVESTNLERSLNLTLQLLKHKVPVVVALNFWDETKHKGISIDDKKLEQILGVPCVPICAVTGEGVNRLVERIKDAKPSAYEYEDKERWHEVGNIVDKVQNITHRHHTWLERFGDASTKPLTGIPIAAVVMYLAFKVIRFIGEGLIGHVGEPVFENLWAPLMMKLSGVLGSEGFFHDLIVGQLIDGEIDFGQSFGLLTTGLFVPIGAVLPYVFAFYVVLSFLEDLGYLPRLAVMVDTLMHRLGLHGFAIIPMLLGLGCNVPGALATRVLETRRERFIAATIMAIAVPCAALQAMVVGLIGKEGLSGLAIVYGTLFAVWVVLGVLFNRTIKGESPEIFIEIPPYRIPYMRGLAKKIWIRIKWFLKEAVPFVLLGVLLVNILYTLKIIQFVGNITAPVVTRVLGLPQEAVGALIIGFLRKDVAVGMLVPLGLTVKQLIIASIVLAMYFPCVATFTTLVKELGVVDMLKSAGIMIVSSLIVGGLLNFILPG